MAKGVGYPFITFQTHLDPALSALHRELVPDWFRFVDLY